MRRHMPQYPRREAQPKNRDPSPPTSPGEWRQDKSVLAFSTLGGICLRLRRVTHPGHRHWFIPPAITSAIDSLDGGRTLRHRNQFSFINSVVDLCADGAVDFLDPLLRELLTIKEKLFEARDGIFLSPFLSKRFRDVLRHIMRRMSRHAE